MATGTKAPASRTLNYGLTGDVMDRVAKASAMSSQVELEKAKVGMAVTEGITRQVGAIGGAVISGRAKTKALNEAFTQKRDKLLETSDARGTFGTPAGMDNYKATLLPLQEEYQDAVRKGNKAAQERIMLELGDREKGLAALRDNHAAVQAAIDNGELMDNTNIVSMPDQIALATLHAGGAEVEYSTAADGTTSRVIPAEAEIISELTTIQEEYGEYAPAKQIEHIDRLLTGSNIGDYSFHDSDTGAIQNVDLGDPSKNADYIRKGILNGTITVKRSFTAGQEKKLAKQNTKPTIIPGAIQDMKATVQKQAGEGTYYDRDTISTNFRDGVNVEDVAYLAYSDSEFDGPSFADDFIEKLDIEGVTIPVYPGSDKYDINKDGVLTPEERLGNDGGTPDDFSDDMAALVVDKQDHKVIFEAMTRPEYKDLFAENYGEWASMKLYKSWEAGYQARKTVKEYDIRGNEIVPPAEVYVEDIYGNKYLSNPANTSTMASTGFNYQASTHPDITGTTQRQ